MGETKGNVGRAEGIELVLTSRGDMGFGGGVEGQTGRGVGIMLVLKLTTRLLISLINKQRILLHTHQSAT